MTMCRLSIVDCRLSIVNFDCYRNPNTNFRVGADRRVRPERIGDPAAITNSAYARGVTSTKMANRHKIRIQPAFRITEPQFDINSA